MLRALTVAAMLTALTLVATTAVAQERVVQIGSLDLTVGDEGSVDLRAHNSAEPLGAWDIEIVYDPAIVSVLECVSMNESICNIQAGSGSIEVTGASAAGFVGDVTLATITLRCDGEGESPLGLMLIVFGEAVGFPIPAESRAGNVVCAASEATPTAAERTPTASDALDSAATPIPVLPETGAGSTGSLGTGSGWFIAALATVGTATLAALGILHRFPRRL